mgnify:CR=1 FL=1
MLPMISPFAPTSDAFVRIDAIICCSLVKPVDPDDLAPAIAVARARFDEWLDARRQRDALRRVAGAHRRRLAGIDGGTVALSGSGRSRRRW